MANKEIRSSSSKILQDMFHDEEMKDFVIVASNGVEVKCLGAVLSAQSDVFARMIAPFTKMKESITKRIEMPHLSEDGVNRLVKYLYGRPLHYSYLGCEGALELFQAAGLYNLKYLKTSLQKMFLEKDIAWFDPNSSLELFFTVKDDDSTNDLQNHLLRAMKAKSDSLRTCDSFKKLDQSAVTELLFKLFKLDKNKIKTPKKRLGPDNYDYYHDEYDYFGLFD